MEDFFVYLRLPREPMDLATLRTLRRAAFLTFLRVDFRERVERLIDLPRQAGVSSTMAPINDS